MVFVPKKSKPKASFDVATILGRNRVKGDVGIEIEVEGKRLPKPELGYTTITGAADWVYHVDGSLRGADNAEYVLKSPLTFGDVPRAINELWDVFQAKKSVLDDSNRTSVHVHLNCQSFHFNRLTSFIALYFTVEEILTEYCGDTRVGNLFCLRAKDAPAIVSQLRDFIRSDGQDPLSEQLHYAGLNPNALVKFGSLEVRTMRGVKDKDTILEWIEILERIYNLSAEFEDPRDMCAMFSAEGPVAFYNNVLGPKAQVVKNVTGFDDDKIRDCMYEGIRLAQDLCYCRDWSQFKGIALKEDPFGRDSRKIARRVAAASIAIDEAQALSQGITSGPLFGGVVQTVNPFIQEFTETEF